MLMMININQLLEKFPMLVKHYDHKNLKISIQSKSFTGKDVTYTQDRTQQVFDLFYREVNRQLF